MAVHYSALGLVNTREMFAKAMAGRYAVPAYNFNNMEQLQAIVASPRHVLVPQSTQGDGVEPIGQDRIGEDRVAHLAQRSDQPVRHRRIEALLAAPEDGGGQAGLLTFLEDVLLPIAAQLVVNGQ